MTYTISLEEAKQSLENLLPVKDGDEIVVTQNGVASAVLLPVGYSHENSTLSKSQEYHVEKEFENYATMFPKQ